MTAQERTDEVDAYRMEVIGLLNMLGQELARDSDQQEPPKWIRDRLADLSAETP